MNNAHPDLSDARVAYIREVPVDTLPEAVRDRLEGAQQVYGIHTEAGKCIALARDRRLAFAVARQNDLAPVSAH